MIPKIIHYSWFSGDPYPKPVKLYLETWKRVLPDYEFVLWDMEKVKEIDSVFLNEALQMHKWAFAADYVRCYAVCQYGGIWLDIDVELRRSFDEFLHHRMFIGKEDNIVCMNDGNGKHVHTLTSHCFGAEVGHPFLKRCLEYYKDRHFITSSDSSLPQRLKYDMRILPDIQCCLAYTEYGYDGGIPNREKEEILDCDIHVFPYWYFEQPKYHDFNTAYCIHHFLSAWQPHKEGLDLGQKGLYLPPRKDLFYYIFSGLNWLLKQRGYMLKVLCFGK